MNSYLVYPIGLGLDLEQLIDGHNLDEQFATEHHGNHNHYHSVADLSATTSNRHELRSG